MDSRSTSLASLAADRQSFDEMLSRLGASAASTLLPEALHVLDEATLTDSDRDARLRRLWARAKPTIGNVAIIAEAARTLRNPSLRNAVAAELPPNLRRLLFGHQQHTVTGTPTPTQLAGTPDAIATPSTASNEASSYSDVLILTLSDAEPTRRLLASAGLAMHRVASLDELSATLCVYNG